MDKIYLLEIGNQDAQNILFASKSKDVLELIMPYVEKAIKWYEKHIYDEYEDICDYVAKQNNMLQEMCPFFTQKEIDCFLNTVPNYCSINRVHVLKDVDV